MSKSTSTLAQRAYQGLKEYLTIACYLWVVFALFVLYKSVVLAEHHIPFAPQGVALLNALALAKVMRSAHRLRLGERFEHAPPVYTTLFKSVLFAVVLACFRILEEALTNLRHGRSASESISAIGGSTLKGILVLTIILAVVLIPYFAFIELGSVLGEDRLRKLMFTPRPSRQCQ